MYRSMWRFINRFTDPEHAVSVFLPVMIIGWTMAGILLGTAVCLLAGQEVMQKLADIVCAGGYMGIFLGLFGGVLFLYRTGV